uniref:Uncharacterized protein n=1 Tax=Anopheles atroparvus TaxID=41427 RepID=A0A182J7W5_ANOAO
MDVGVSGASSVATGVFKSPNTICPMDGKVPAHVPNVVDACEYPFESMTQARVIQRRENTLGLTGATVAPTAAGAATTVATKSSNGNFLAPAASSAVPPPPPPPYPSAGGAVAGAGNNVAMSSPLLVNLLQNETNQQQQTTLSALQQQQQQQQQQLLQLQQQQLMRGGGGAQPILKQELLIPGSANVGPASVKSGGTVGSGIIPTVVMGGGTMPPGVALGAVQNNVGDNDASVLGNSLKSGGGSGPVAGHSGVAGSVNRQHPLHHPVIGGASALATVSMVSSGQPHQQQQTLVNSNSSPLRGAPMAAQQQQQQQQLPFRQPNPLGVQPQQANHTNTVGFNQRWPTLPMDSATKSSFQEFARYQMQYNLSQQQLNKPPVTSTTTSATLGLDASSSAGETTPSTSAVGDSLELGNCLVDLPDLAKNDLDSLLPSDLDSAFLDTKLDDLDDLDLMDQQHQHHSPLGSVPLHSSSSDHLATLPGTLLGGGTSDGSMVALDEQGMVSGASGAPGPQGMAPTAEARRAWKAQVLINPLTGELEETPVEEGAEESEDAAKATRSAKWSSSLRVNDFPPETANLLYSDEDTTGSAGGLSSSRFTSDLSDTDRPSPAGLLGTDGMSSLVAIAGSSGSSSSALVVGTGAAVATTSAVGGAQASQGKTGKIKKERPMKPTKAKEKLKLSSSSSSWKEKPREKTKATLSKPVKQKAKVVSTSVLSVGGASSDAASKNCTEIKLRLKLEKSAPITLTVPARVAGAGSAGIAAAGSSPSTIGPVIGGDFCPKTPPTFDGTAGGASASTALTTAVSAQAKDRKKSQSGGEEDSSDGGGGVKRSSATGKRNSVDLNMTPLIAGGSPPSLGGTAVAPPSATFHNHVPKPNDPPSADGLPSQKRPAEAMASPETHTITGHSPNGIVCPEKKRRLSTGGSSVSVPAASGMQLPTTSVAEGAGVAASMTTAVTAGEELDHQHGSVTAALSAESVGEATGGSSAPAVTPSSTSTSDTSSSTMEIVDRHRDQEHHSKNRPPEQLLADVVDVGERREDEEERVKLIDVDDEMGPRATEQQDNRGAGQARANVARTADSATGNATGVGGETGTGTGTTMASEAAGVGVGVTVSAAAAAAAIGVNHHLLGHSSHLEKPKEQIGTPPLLDASMEDYHDIEAALAKMEGLNEIAAAVGCDVDAKLNGDHAILMKPKLLDYNHETLSNLDRTNLSKILDNMEVEEELKQLQRIDNGIADGSSVLDDGANAAARKKPADPVKPNTLHAEDCLTTTVNAAPKQQQQQQQPSATRKRSVEKRDDGGAGGKSRSQPSVRMAQLRKSVESDSAVLVVQDGGNNNHSDEERKKLLVVTGAAAVAAESKPGALLLPVDECCKNSKDSTSVKSECDSTVMVMQIDSKQVLVKSDPEEAIVSSVRKSLRKSSDEHHAAAALTVAAMTTTTERAKATGSTVACDVSIVKLEGSPAKVSGAPGGSVGEAKVEPKSPESAEPLIELKPRHEQPPLYSYSSEKARERRTAAAASDGSLPGHGPAVSAGGKSRRNSSVTSAEGSRSGDESTATRHSSSSSVPSGTTPAKKSSRSSSVGSDSAYTNRTLKTNDLSTPAVSTARSVEQQNSSKEVLTQLSIEIPSHSDSGEHRIRTRASSKLESPLEVLARQSPSTAGNDGQQQPQCLPSAVATAAGGSGGTGGVGGSAQQPPKGAVSAGAAVAGSGKQSVSTIAASSSGGGAVASTVAATASSDRQSPKSGTASTKTTGGGNKRKRQGSESSNQSGVSDDIPTRAKKSRKAASSVVSENNPVAAAATGTPKAQCYYILLYPTCYRFFYYYYHYYFYSSLYYYFYDHYYQQNQQPQQQQHYDYNFFIFVQIHSSIFGRQTQRNDRSVR